MTRRLRVALIGAGKVGDAYRCTLPTYQTVDVDPVGMTAVVDVPDDVYPLTSDDGPVSSTVDVKNGDMVTGLTAQQKLKAAMRFDKKYAEHAGEFSLDVK